MNKCFLLQIYDIFLITNLIENYCMDQCILNVEVSRLMIYIAKNNSAFNDLQTCKSQQ